MRDLILKLVAPEFVGKKIQRLSKTRFVSDEEMATQRRTFSFDEMRMKIATTIAERMIEDGLVQISSSYDSSLMGNQYRVSIDVIKNI